MVSVEMCPWSKEMFAVFYEMCVSCMRLRMKSICHVKSRKTSNEMLLFSVNNVSISDNCTSSRSEVKGHLGCYQQCCRCFREECH